ncbi:LysR substrate-binding domain-containing protein [Roseibium sp.]|uniref:LysR substrate-binding domain-containing protein n=1 Tax=Roseibium sp. TaxID=1936156 RepID=UPI003267E6A6
MVRRLLPPLSALPAFEAVARLGSMKAAADELGRTHGAISKQVAHLSEDLGVPLFAKQGVGVVLTKEGRDFAVTVADVLDILAESRSHFHRRADDAVIEIGISATYAMRWLMPRMPDLYQSVPGIELSFRMTGREQIPNHDLDLILTWDRLNWSDGFYEDPDIRTLGDVSFGLAHAPSVTLEKTATGYHCDTRFLQEIAPHTWAGWEDMADIRVSAEHDRAFPHLFLAIEAAVAGLGVALVEKRLVADELSSGRLVAPFGFHRIERGFGAIVTSRGRDRGKVQALLDWLERQD